MNDSRLRDDSCTAVQILSTLAMSRDSSRHSYITLRPSAAVGFYWRRIAPRYSAKSDTFQYLDHDFNLISLTIALRGIAAKQRLEIAASPLLLSPSRDGGLP